MSRTEFGGPVRVVASALTIFVASQALAILLVGFGLGLIHPGQDIASLLDNSTPAQFFYILIAEGLAVSLTLRLVKHRRLRLASIGLRRPKFNDLTRGLIGFGIFYVLLILVSIVLTMIFPELNNTPQNVGFNDLTTNTDNILALIALVILPPLGEETLVRGYLFSGLRSKLTFRNAAIITSILFAVAHLEIGSGTALVWGAAADTFVLSMVLCWLRQSSGALYGGMLVHGLNNLIAFMVKFH